jgi:hypothetical protein
MRCLFSHPELLKGTRLRQVRVLDCPVHLMKFSLLNSGEISGKGAGRTMGNSPCSR